MIKKTIPYTDHNGAARSRDFWFKIGHGEFVKRLMIEGGEGFLEKLNELSKIKPEDMPRGGVQTLMDTFDMLLGAAVGIREGDNLIKSEQIYKDFMFSGAYDALFMELIQTEDSGATFMSKILPTNLAAAIAEANVERSKAGLDLLPMPGESSEPAPEHILNGGTEAAIAANTPADIPAAPPTLAPEGEGTDDEPKWLKENRYATAKELLGASTYEIRLATKMKQAKAFD